MLSDELECTLDDTALLDIELIPGVEEILLELVLDAEVVLDLELALDIAAMLDLELELMTEFGLASVRTVNGADLADGLPAKSKALIEYV